MLIRMFRLALFLVALIVCLVTFYATSNDAFASSSCLRVARTAAGEVLVNKCGSCVMANVTRERPGYGRPHNRTYHVQAQSTRSLPFRGPGRTRIGQARPCDAANSGVDDALNRSLQAQNQQCLAMRQDAASRTIFVTNSCQACRVAGVERYDARKRSLGKQVMVVGPKQSLPITAQGAAHVGLAGDMACPANVRG